MVDQSKYKAYVISTNPSGRKYRFYRHEQLLWNALDQLKDRYSWLQWVWIGDERHTRREFLYVPAVVHAPVKLYIDFTGKTGLKRKSVRKREDIMKEKGMQYIHLNPLDSQQTMYFSITTKLAKINREDKKG
ncbi:hypothetical protein IH575_04565 [Candidatus Dojkabacteria bacterium]|nr:hypothetical protein [Candidatus Dojkabacteria bacterium]